MAGTASTLTTRSLHPDPDSSDRIVVDLLAGARPTLVFLHGLTSTRVGTKSEALLERARRRGLGFARFDFRGHGESDGDLRRLRFTQLVEDTRAVIEAVGPCVLVGSSMGALAAAWTTARHPAGIGALVLLSPALGFLARMAQANGQYQLRRDDGQIITFAAEVLRDAALYDEGRLPAQLALPVFMTHGSEDQTVPCASTLALCEAIPHADKELWVVQGGSHSLDEVTDATFDRVELFLEQRGLI
jgi:pimeloyl-ACP methyl ester carboxylesterase